MLGHREAPREALVPHLAIDVLLFGAFAAAPQPVRPRSSQAAYNALAPSVTRAIGLCLDCQSAVCARLPRSGGPCPEAEIYRVGGWAAWLIRSVQLFGLLLTYQAATALDVLELAGIRQALGQAHTPRVEIVGPYRWVRHPLYAGWMMFVFGSPDMTMDRLTFAVVSSAYILAAIPWEERSLRTSNPEGYRRYMETVKWRLLPYVY